MQRLTRHIGITVVSGVLLATVLLLSVDSFFQLMAELSDLGEGDYGLAQIFLHVLLCLPSRLYLMFPMAALLGTVVGLGTLAGHNELVVMRASGVSQSAVAWAIFKVMLWLVAAVFILGETVVPVAEQAAQAKKIVAKTGGQALKTPRGVWVRNDRSFVHITSVSLKGHLTGVVRYQFNKQHQLSMVNTAKTANYDGQQWTLKDVEAIRLMEAQVATQFTPQVVWKTLLDPALLRIVSVEQDNLSLAALKRIIDYRRNNGLSYERYAVTFWQKCVQPIATLVVALLVVPFIFSVHHRTHMGLRLVYGILAGFAFYLLNHLFTSIAQIYQVPAFIASLLPMTIFSSLTMLLLYWLNGGKNKLSS